MPILGIMGVVVAMSGPAEPTALTMTAYRRLEPGADEPGDAAADAPMQPTSSKAPESALQPTSSKAPESAPAPEPDEPVTPEPVTPEPAADAPTEDLTLEQERRGAARDTGFRRHGVGAHGGIVVIPTWILSTFLASHTNALCRGSIGNFAAERGLNRQDGCNFYVGANYTHRFSRVIDVAASVQYQRLKVPDGLWIDDTRLDVSDGLLGVADYTEVDLGLIAMEVDFIARAPVVVTKDVELGIGGGAGLGLGVVLGGVSQTTLGLDPAGFSGGMRTDGTCESLDDFGDLTRCTPRWDPAQAGDNPPPDPSELSNPNPELFANCTATECSEQDLRAFGYRREQGSIPPVIPVLNLIVSMRLMIKDTVGITLNGGWNTGFYFGGGVQYYFGKPQQDEMSKGATIGRRRRRSGRV